VLTIHPIRNTSQKYFDDLTTLYIGSSFGKGGCSKVQGTCVGQGGDVKPMPLSMAEPVAPEKRAITTLKYQKGVIIRGKLRGPLKINEQKKVGGLPRDKVFNKKKGEGKRLGGKS